MQSLPRSGPGTDQESDFPAWFDAQVKAQGLDHWGLADLDLSQAEAGLLQWLAAGFHGEMDYMARNPERRLRPSAIFPGARSAIMVAASYRPEDPAWLAKRWALIGQRKHAGISMYALGTDYHRLVRKRLQALGEVLRAWFDARPDAGALTQARQVEAPRSPPAEGFRFRAFCDSAPLLEVELARKAAIGWRGKHTLLLHRERGSLFFLGTLLNNVSTGQWARLLDSTVTQRSDREHCGNCQACLEICPTQAILAPYRLDARRCIAYLTIEHHGPIPEEFRAAIGNRIYGCDDCQLICPWNKFAVSLKLSGLRARPELEGLDLLEAMSWDEPRFLQATAGTAIRRIGHRRWLRNVAVALGNLLDGPGGHDLDYAKRALALLRGRRAEADPMVADHIDWALRRLEAGIAKHHAGSAKHHAANATHYAADAKHHAADPGAKSSRSDPRGAASPGSGGEQTRSNARPQGKTDE